MHAHKFTKMHKSDFAMPIFCVLKYYSQFEISCSIYRLLGLTMQVGKKKKKSQIRDGQRSFDKFFMANWHCVLEPDETQVKNWPEPIQWGSVAHR